MRCRFVASADIFYIGGSILSKSELITFRFQCIGGETLTTKTRWFGVVVEHKQAIFFLGPSQLELREVPIPDPGPGEVIVKVAAALTCGTDLKGYLRGHRLFVPPMPFGHEFAGLISAVGAGVAGWRAGDAVTAANSAPCNACFYCRRGRQQLCEQLDSRFNWGAFAEYIRVPAHIVAQNMHRVPAALPFAQAALIEPLACALHGVRDAAIQLGDTVAIIGAGAQGLMQVQLARAQRRGASDRDWARARAAGARAPAGRA